MAESKNEQVLEKPADTSNPNICKRLIKIKNNLGKEVEIPCGGSIFVDTIEQRSTNAIVYSHCGRCESKETDEFKKPSITHTEKCLQGQAVIGKNPTIYLSTVINQIVWKCDGVITKNHIDDYVCGATVIQDGGFPF